MRKRRYNYMFYLLLFLIVLSLFGVTIGVSMFLVVITDATINAEILENGQHGLAIIISLSLIFQSFMVVPILYKIILFLERKSDDVEKRRGN